MVTEERGTLKSFAKNSTQASLARPSTGGAVSPSFSAELVGLARLWNYTPGSDMPWPEQYLNGKVQLERNLARAAQAVS